ncbi:hypothetical protein HY604_00235, partial [Candidatus Peregrinibacteria bacterium]|nr:hypothetical protein [Candidatus Peregrinibacteria bacterium]
MKNLEKNTIESFGHSVGKVSPGIKKDLHAQFVKLGISRNRLTRELLMLLPEIFKSGIYREYSATIVEYAGRFGGLS